MVKTQVQNKFHEYISLYWTIKFWTVQFFFYLFTLKHVRYEQKASWFKVTDLPFKITFSGLSRQLPHHGPFFFFTMGTELLNSCFKFSQISLVWKASGGLKESTDPKPEGTAWEEKKQNIFPGLVPCEFITRVGTVNMWFYCNMRCLKRDFQFVVRHHFYIILISIITKRNLFKIFLLTDDKLLSITQNGGANLALNLDPKFTEAEVQLSWEREREKRGVAKSPVSLICDMALAHMGIFAVQYEWVEKETETLFPLLLASSPASTSKRQVAKALRKPTQLLSYVPTQTHTEAATRHTL